MAHHPSAGPASPDDDYLQTPPGSTYEHTDASPKPLMSFLFWCLVSALAIHLGLAGAWQFLISAGVSREADERRYPLAAAQPHQLPPLPRLQQFPENERYAFRREEQRLLNSYSWENKEAGTVRIPIAEAMRLVVERGLPSRESAADSAPDLMPADSSSGRTGERRRQ
jgi:hypothetical protein